MNNIDQVMEEKLLQEAFMLPFGLKPVGKIGNQKVYGSKKLDEKVIDVLSNNQHTKVLSEVLAKLIRSKKIIICYLHKGILGFTAWRIFAPDNVKGIQAFYTPIEKKTYFLLTNISLLVGYVANTKISNYMVHECMHMAMSIKTSSTFSLFKPELIKYYSKFFTHVFKIKEPSEKLILNIVTFLLNESEIAENVKPSNFLPKYEDFVKKLSDDKKVIDHFIDCVYNFMNGKAFENPRGYIHYFRDIIGPLYKAYDTAFGFKNFSSFCVQELIYPSEVLAIYSESGKIDTKIKTTFASL
jgi:hypothetical protein